MPGESKNASNWYRVALKRHDHVLTEFYRTKLDELLHLKLDGPQSD
ncbi:hypothetical protein JN086_14340 [Mycolicibacterium austroafricanum]|uniref:Uncharacterized protein n=1 Tax=Mycolicibacterium austroafricanum TaxID=39687 RepID=A0ABT8HIF1_MYCAO|nr:hypothetical protein [Mycolicibacterium austroafricanum]MDN4520518.1 hypothetical protein [Mycolicibacterium austroafricanum]QRZ09399.1 hypothetical protein JN090_13375 [Mycolicibacterium austroafricanum]QZT71051.1 hypothetical protein JN086_14340 [Mycolicibacterium austroafricanum]